MKSLKQIKLFINSGVLKTSINPNFSTAVLENIPLPKENPVVTCVPGDGVWPELFDHMKFIFQEGKIPINFEHFDLSELQSGKCDDLEEVISSIRRNRIAIKGIIATPMEGPELKTLNMNFRRRLDLFANVMRVKSFEGYETRYNDLDFVVIREQTEGEYSALEHESIPGVVESLKIITRAKSERIAKFAFDYARKHGRKRVTAVHKANIMKLGDGEFLRGCEKVSRLYPGIEYDNIIVDNCCMQLVSRPGQFDVMVMPNLYGAIVDNVAAGLVGGAGVVPGESYSRDVAVFEPGTRHSYAVAVGRNIANPVALLLSSVSMLRHLNLFRHARQLESAVLGCVRDGKVRTGDMHGGRSSTEDMVHDIMARLKDISTE